MENMKCSRARRKNKGSNVFAFSFVKSLLNCLLFFFSNKSVFDCFVFGCNEKWPSNFYTWTKVDGLHHGSRGNENENLRFFSSATKLNRPCRRVDEDNLLLLLLPLDEFFFLPVLLFCSCSANDPAAADDIDDLVPRNIGFGKGAIC